MNATELHEGLKALCAMIGEKCEAHIVMSGSYKLIATVEPLGIMGRVRLTANVSEWDEVIPALTAKWEEHRELHEQGVIRNMAMAIIRITMERDECRDADLRCDFSHQDIDGYAERAASLATEMGGKGPFMVIRTDTGNGHEVEE